MCDPDDVAVNSCNENGLVKIDCKTNQDGKTKCHEGNCVNPEGEEYECSNDTHCAGKEGKPYCVEHKCVESKPQETEDPCKDVTCTEGTCYLHICVTSAMQDLADGANCNTNEFQSFCDAKELVECSNNKIVRTNCEQDNIGKCTVFENYGEYIAACSGNDKAKELCEENESLDTPAATINVCYGDQDWGTSAICIEDILGEMVAYPFSRSAEDFFLDCEGKRCEYDGDDNPICGTEDAAN